MCEFCTKHGEGEKWYLNMSNYSAELFHQDGRREYVEDFLAQIEERIVTGMARFDRLKRRPAAYRFLKRMLIRRQKAGHWGQVVPVEDVEKIIVFQDSIVRLPCVCRSMTTGRSEARYCFGIGMDLPRILGRYPDYSGSFEVMTGDAAGKAIRSLDQAGMVHSVWTFKTPYIGGICNCDQDCMAYRSQTKAGFPVMFRSEYIGLVDWEKCNGCRKCLLNCQFGAIRYSHSLERPTIDATACFGCGVCRAVCEQSAITLKPRAGKSEYLLPVRSGSCSVSVEPRLCRSPEKCRLCLDRCPGKVFGIYPRSRREAGKAAENWVVVPMRGSMCNGCMECASFCPQGAIAVIEKN